MAFSKKSAFLLVLLVGVVGVIMKFILDPFGGEEKQESPKTATAPKKEAQPVRQEQAQGTPAPAPSTTSVAGQTKQVTVTTSYGSPAGPEEVGFTLGVDTNGVIVSADTVVKAGDPASTNFQENFKANLPGAVVGKKLTDLTRIDKVGQASLTTGAFNQVLAQMKSQL